jgi:hypothetical protein
VSGLLGEGSNSMLKDPIEPVLLPEILTNQAISATTNNYTKDFGAFYKQRIKALAYGTNNECRTTDYLLIHVVDAVGVAAYSTYQIGFDPLGEDIFVNDARVLNESGETITTIKSSDCYVIGDTADGKVSSQKLLNIPIAGLQAGYDVSLTITRSSGNSQEGLPFLEHCFSKSYPVLTSGVFVRGDDCKDHAVLLQQLLKCADIPANITLISSEDPVQVDLPSMDQFNHMIVEIPLKNGERFIDCTDKASDLACIPPLGLAGQQALVLNPDHPHLVKLPDYSTNASSIEVHQHVYFQGTNDLALDETLSLTGVHASYLREYLLGISPTYRQESLQRDMGLSDAVMSKCEITSLENPRQPLQINCSLIFKNQFHSTQNGYVGTLSGGLERFYMTATPVNNRVTPFEITVPLQIHCQIVFDLPKGYHSVEKHEPVEKLDQRYITFQTQHKLDEGKLNLTYQIQLPVGHFNATNYSSYWDTMELLQSFVNYEIDLQAD